MKRQHREGGECNLNAIILIFKPLCRYILDKQHLLAHEIQFTVNLIALKRMIMACILDFQTFNIVDIF